MTIEIGTQYSKSIEIKASETAIELGSGGLDVYGTPALVALMENVALSAIKPFLKETEDSVGIEIKVQHLKASTVGEKINCTAQVSNIEGARIYFDLVATNEKDEVIGKGTHIRFIVDKDRFMSKLKK